MRTASNSRWSGYAGTISIESMYGGESYAAREPIPTMPHEPSLALLKWLAALLNMAVEPLALCYPGLAGGTFRAGQHLDSEQFRSDPRTCRPGRGKLSVRPTCAAPRPKARPF